MTRLDYGDKIGPFPYRIISQLGRGEGSFSDIYLATDGDLEEGPRIVLKISRANSNEHNFYNDTIYNEAERLRQLDYPGVVRLLPVKTESRMHNLPYVAKAALPGQPWFLVLEYLSGGGLDQLLTREKRLPQLLALNIAQRLAVTLEYIHSHNIVHLDVKPANILFRRPIQPDVAADPVLIDFGIARRTGQEGLEAATVLYAPPEQLSQQHTRPIGIESGPLPSMDIYSLGVVLYQMITGNQPFATRKTKHLTPAILDTEPVKPSVYVQHLDPEIEDIVMRAMARNPVNRPGAGDLAIRLGTIATRLSNSTATVDTTRKFVTQNPRSFVLNAYREHWLVVFLIFIFLFAVGLLAILISSGLI